MNGADWLARSLKASGQTHLFFVDAVLRRTLLELERVGVTTGMRKVLAKACTSLRPGQSKTPKPKQPRKGK